MEAPILSKFDFSRPFIRDVDRYVKGVSAILSQKDGRTEMVVVYASKKLFDVQRGFILWRENVMKWYGEWTTFLTISTSNIVFVENWP